MEQPIVNVPMCKACRLAAYPDDPEAWNFIAKAWSKPVKGGRNAQIVCPGPVQEAYYKPLETRFKKIITRSRNKLPKADSKAMSVIFRIERACQWIFEPSVDTVPVWCPHYRREV